MPVTRGWMVFALMLGACQGAAPPAPASPASEPAPSALEAPPDPPPPASSASAEAPSPPASDPQGSKSSDDGLVLGELAPYGLESGRAPHVPGPGGGSERPKLSTSDAAARVAKLRARFRSCYNKALSTDPELSGRAVFRFAVDSTGQLTNVSLDEAQTSPSMRKGPLTDCLLEVFRSANIGPTGQSAPVTLSLPIEIRAATPDPSPE